MNTPPPVQKPFYFKLAVEMAELASQDEMRINILTVDDGEAENMKIVGMDKDGPHPCIKVEDVEGDQIYIFIGKIISITPVEEIEEEDEGKEDDDEPEEDLEEDE